MSALENEGRKGSRGEPLPEEYEGLPDSSHLGGLCPRCGKLSSFVFKESIAVTYKGPSYTIHPNGSWGATDFDRVSVVQCHHCKQGIVVIEEKWVGDRPAREKATEEGGGRIFYQGVYWWPLPETNLSKDIPQDIAGAFAEASLALHAHCPRAAIVMARRTLEAVVIDKGETSQKDTLATRLKSLVTKGVLPPTIAEWAHEVRLVGNTGAHYDPLNPVSVEDASELIGFLRELLRHLYEIPADLDRRRSLRQKKP